MQVAEEDFRQAGMLAHAAGARWSIAMMRGESSGAAAEEATMRELGIVRPRRFVAVMIGAHDLADPP